MLTLRDIRPLSQAIRPYPFASSNYFPGNSISSLRTITESRSFLRKEPGRVREDHPRRKRSLENLGLELEREPETNAPDAAILQRLVGEAGALLPQTGVIDEWINTSLTDDAAKVRVVEDICHGRVEDYVQPLFYLEVFGKREVAGVRSGVAQTVACNIAEGRIEHRGRYGSVGDESHVLVCYWRTNRVASVDGIQADQLGRSQLAAHTEIVASIASKNAHGTHRRRGVTEEWPQVLIHRARERCCERVIVERPTPIQRKLDWSIGLARSDEVGPCDGPATQDMSEETLLRPKCRYLLIERH